MIFGNELILDIKDCDISRFNRKDITRYFKELCELIDMVREDLHFWDYEDDPEAYAKAESHLRGTSAIQFITTSNITIHTLDDFKCIYLNIFSCKHYAPDIVMDFTEKFFKGETFNKVSIQRNRP